MLPKLKGDTFFIPMPDGIYFRNNQGSLKIKGKVIYRWVESLAPYLTGEHSLSQITAGLDSEKQKMVTDLVDTLLKQGFLKDLSQDLPHNLSQTERETYAAEIAFIDSFCDSAASRFERFRERQVLLIGSGLTLTGLVHASLKSGLRQVAVITTPECETNTHRHQEYLDLFHKGDPRQTLKEIASPAWENEAEVLATLQPFDTIIHVSDRPMLARASLLNRLCVTHKKTLIQAVIVDDHAWIGPLVCPPDRRDSGLSLFAGCWECAWLRLQGNLTNMQEQLPLYAFRDQTTAPISRFVALPTAAFVANQLSFEVFKSLTEAGPVETAGNLIEVNLETLRTQKHPFMPHPLCRSCQQREPRTAAQFLESIRQLEQPDVAQTEAQPSEQAEEAQTSDQPSEGQDQFSRKVAPCFEKHLGLFSSLDEGDLVQLPLSVCKAVVSNPLPQEQTANPCAVLGCGFTFGEARRRAAERACEIYAASLADLRLFPSIETVQAELALVREGTPTVVTGLAPVRTIPLERFLTAIPLDKTKEWTWAIDLSTGQACLVPAPLVYPVLRGLSPLADASLFIGLGKSWDEAVVRALLSVCQYLTITQLTYAQYPQVDPTALPLSPNGTRLLHMLEEMGGNVTVYDVTGPLQVPTLAICLEEPTVAYGTNVEATLALQDGLEQAVLFKQLSDEQVLIENLPFVPSLPLAMRSEGIPGVHQTGPAQGIYGAAQEWPDLKLWLQDVLQMNGWRTFAVPLDHDPVLREIQPYIVHVVVART